MDATAPKKIYFSIGEVSVMTDVPQHVLRYWEEVFPTLRPPKRRSGSRAYREQDIEKVRLIKQLLYEKGFTIRGARKHLREGLVENQKQQKIRSFSDELAEIEKRLEEILDILDSD
ncbi:MAG: MerR family transcriptional regulator [Candidatus Abyssubacteria bacterium]